MIRAPLGTAMAKKLTLAGGMLIASIPHAQSEVVVIANSGASIERLSRQQVTDLYLGKTEKLPSGVVLECADLPSDHPIRDRFYRDVVRRNPEQVSTYRKRRTRTGYGKMPVTRMSENEILNWVSKAPGRIGYVDSASLTVKVKVLLEAGGRNGISKANLLAAHDSRM